MKKIGARLLVLTLFSLMLTINCFMTTSAADFGASTSIYSTQYYSPTTNPFGSAYSSLISGTSARQSTIAGQDNDFYDLQLFIPPLGCQPYVVRSDLLEEQNVPVFCNLVPLKINPGIDITRINSISIVKKENNPYVTGVGFHPANAAIKSRSGNYGVASGGSIGYVVVVLKQQEVEKNMPANITITLAARIDYGAENSFGIGKNEFYIPELTDEQFANDYADYSFYDGVGYLRAENIDSKSAKIIIYDSANNIIFSDTIEKGATSRDFYLPNGRGGQGIRITLKDITLPNRKAKIRVNDEKFDVYEGQEFGNGCRLINVQPLGLGAGKANIVCNKVSISLDKQINKVSLQVGDKQSDYGLGEFVKNDYYLVLANSIKNTKESYVILANIDAATKKAFGIELNNNLNKLSEELGRLAKDKYLENVRNIKSITIDGRSIPLIVLAEGDPANSGITFTGLKIKDSNIDKNQNPYYEKAMNAYDYVKDSFGVEIFPSGTTTPHTYSEEALWAEYDLAVNLKQQEKQKEVLSRILNEYPASVHKSQTASSAIESMGLLANNPGASYYDSKNDINVELISITEPSSAEQGVDISYSIGGKIEVRSGVRAGEVINSDTTDKIITLESFDETTAHVRCSDKTSTEIETETGTISKPIIFKKGKCADARVYINKINLRKVAQVQIIPITHGRSRESNFTFSIGIEKRALGLNLTPEEANSKITALNKQIAKLRNITDNLGKLIEGGNAACIATSAIINIKNLLSGKGGEASARTEVMKKWNDICSSSAYWQENGRNYANSEDCIAGEYDNKIKPEIESTTAAMKAYNTAEQTATAKYKDYKGSSEAKDNKIKLEIYNSLKDKMPATSKFSGDCTTDANGKETCKTEIIFSDVVNENTMGSITYAELSAIYVDMQLMDAAKDTESSKQYNTAVYNSLKDIKNRLDATNRQQAVAKDLNNVPLSYSESQTRDVRTWRDLYWNNDFRTNYNFYKAPDVEIAENSKIAIVPSNDLTSKDNYLVVLDGSGKTLDVKPGEVYKIFTEADGNNFAIKLLADESKYVPANLAFQVVDAGDYKNKCTNCNFAKIFSLEPYKGQPAMLPFDFDNGFYVQTKNDLPTSGLGTGNVPAFQDSGKVNTFYLCNVGKNKLMEGYQINDDTCIRFDFYTGASIETAFGMNVEQTKAKVKEALYWFQDAQKQLKTNPSATTIKINSRTLTIKNSEGDTGTKCTDFMSPDDCQIIYNVCDPFVCPNSRCDFGGRYPVDNVIQSGVIGSTLLCLPNFIGLHPDTGVVLPVCVTGINAGLNGWVSILEDYRDCINESTTTGRMVGICDAVYSVYVCDFFWRQAGPLATTLMKDLFLGIFGVKDHGGGEYLFVQDAWNSAAKSAQYFQTTYAQDSKLSFGFENIANSAVAEVCKSQGSATYPDNFKTMLEPEIPIQFTASFEELPYTSATVPPTSQYNVFYHIYAGDEGHYFQIYLKSPTTSIGYTGRESAVVKSGYVTKGESATETVNYLDTSGYKQLCVRIDTQEKCGFKSVTTSAALNYAKDKAVQDQATTQVTSESECIAGSHSAGAFLTPNIQQGVEEFINPEMYNQGVIRVCANKNPGENVDPNRWSDVGYCDDRSVRCWIDGKSVKKAIQFKGIENDTLAEIAKIKMQNLQEQGGYFDDIEGAAQVKTLKQVYISISEQVKTSSDAGIGYANSLKDFNDVDYQDRTIASLDADVAALDKKLIYSKDRAALWFAKAEIYDAFAVKIGVKATADAVAGKDTNLPVPVQVIKVSPEYKIEENEIVFYLDTQRFSTNLLRAGNSIKYGLKVVATITENKINYPNEITSLPDEVKKILNEIKGARISSDGSITLDKSASTNDVPIPSDTI